MSLFSQVVFPVFGMLMILLAIGAFFLPYGNKIKDATQKFDAFGLKMEISVVTAIILGGMIFCGVGFYLNEHSYKLDYDKATVTIAEKDSEIQRQKNLVEAKNEEIRSMTTQNITYHFVLDDLDPTTAPPPANSLLCIFYKNWRDKTDSSIYNVFSSGANAFKVTFENLSLQQLTDAAPAVYLYDKRTHKRWVSQSFNPLTPTINLLPDNQ